MIEKQVLVDLSFPMPSDVHGRFSIADLYKPGYRCGIYVRYFKTGEHYAGQAIDVTRCFCQHRRNHGDIVGISFKTVPNSDMDDVEREVVWTLEEKGFKLRNIALTSIPKGEADFDEIMLEADQDRWLSDFTFIDAAGSRLTAPDLRRKYHRKFEQLMKKPYASEIIQILRIYAQLGILANKRSELQTN